VRTYVVFYDDDSMGKGNGARIGLGSAAGGREAVLVAGRAPRDGDGERLVRFSYATSGAVRRGPVTFRERDLAKLAALLCRAPELGRALRTVTGDGVGNV